jgi:ADP-glucose pyrophosphorylase
LAQGLDHLPLFHECFVSVVPAPMQEGPQWFAGTSDVVCQNLSLIMERHKEIAGGTCIGFDADADRKRFMVGPGGIVVVPRGEPTSTPAAIGVCVPDTRSRRMGHA